MLYLFFVNLYVVYFMYHSKQLFFTNIKTGWYFGFDKAFANYFFNLADLTDLFTIYDRD